MESGAPDKKQVRVTIFNQTYALRTKGDVRETEELAQTVDDLMTTIARRSGNIDTSRVAVLACLHLADRLKTLETDLTSLQDRVTETSRDFSELLDGALNAREDGD